MVAEGGDFDCPPVRSLMRVGSGGFLGEERVNRLGCKRQAVGGAQVRRIRRWLGLGPGLQVDPLRAVWVLVDCLQSQVSGRDRDVRTALLRRQILVHCMVV